MSKSIFVTNKGNLPVTGRFENREYVFSCGKEVEISLEIAKHIFGYGFVFSSEPNKPVHLSAPVVERVAAPMPEFKARGKGAAKVHAH
jgi:hypothetical protein